MIIVDALRSKVEAPIIDDLRILVHVLRLYMQMNIPIVVQHNTSFLVEYYTPKNMHTIKT